MRVTRHALAAARAVSRMACSTGTQALRMTVPRAAAVGVRWNSEAATMTEGEETEYITDESSGAMEDMDIDALLAMMQAAEAAEGGGAAGTRDLPPVAVPSDLEFIVSPLWASTNAANVAFDDIQSEMAEFLETVDRQVSFVSQYFDAPVINPAECRLAMDALFTTKIKTMGDAPSTELAEEVFINEEVFKDWMDARKAFSAIEMSNMTKAAITAAVEANQPYLLRRVMEVVDRIVEVTSVVSAVTVESAVELSAAQRKSIESVLPKFLPEGKTELDVSYAVSPGLMGGLSISMDNAVIDLSAASYLSAATENLVEVKEE